ncbi:MAG: PadR family transcriptional regulator [Streptosporangiales bacterium]
MATRTLNATAGALLGFLHAGPMSGWDLVATARTVVGDFWTVTQSQVYRELAAMSRDGLVSAGGAGARERRPYKITAAGRSAFATWLRQPPGTEQIRYPLLLTLSFGAHLPPDLLTEFVAEHRAEHAERLAAYRQRRAAMGGDADPYTAATLDFGIRYETAVLQWCDHLPPAIRRRSTP